MSVAFGTHMFLFHFGHSLSNSVPISAHLVSSINSRARSMIHPRARARLFNSIGSEESQHWRQQRQENVAQEMHRHWNSYVFTNTNAHTHRLMLEITPSHSLAHIFAHTVKYRSLTHQYGSARTLECSATHCNIL